MNTRTLFLSLASLLVAALPAQALTINSTSSTGIFPVANDDLIEGLTPAIVGGIEDKETFNSDTTGGALTNGTFPSTQNGFVGYKELDVIGSAIPEPSAIALSALGLLSLGIVGWRRRSR